MEILDTLSQFSPMATVALALVIIWQLIRNGRTIGGKVKELGSNHLVHLEEKLDDQVIAIKSHIDLHERREMEQGTRMIESLRRIEEILNRIDSRKPRRTSGGGAGTSRGSGFQYQYARTVSFAR